MEVKCGDGVCRGEVCGGGVCGGEVCGDVVCQDGWMVNGNKLAFGSDGLRNNLIPYTITYVES